ncbi:unnamed protein product [Symbiodinium microadriaticum]|nr:unnamed protein product [Symbiodinium microadriaticum]
MPQAALSQLFRALGAAAGRVCSLRIASASALPLDMEHRLIQGQPTRIEGEHPRTLYTVSIGEAMSCGDQSIDEGSEVPWHAHEASEEVLRCVAGSGTIYCGDVVKDFLPGVTVLVPKQTPHRIVNCSRSEKLWLSWTLSPPQSTKQFQAGENRVQEDVLDCDLSGCADPITAATVRD